MDQHPQSVFESLSKPLQSILKEAGIEAPTETQLKAIPAIRSRGNVLLVAPTGTGKTEAALLPIIDRLLVEENVPGISVIYITPLRALNRDLLNRLEGWCKKLDIRLAVRHGDTDIKDRSRQAMEPPQILITTPETLQAILPGRVMRKHLSNVRWVIVDEVHELTSNKRGSQLSIALERLRALSQSGFQLIGLSATIGTPDEVARFLVGSARSFTVVEVAVARHMEVRVLCPEPQAQDVDLASKILTYPDVTARLRTIYDEMQNHRSLLVFTNTRSESEALISRFRIWDPELPLGIHHGSLSKSSRMAVESSLKQGRLHGVVCTSSLEMGIDIGLLDFVIQYGSPRQVTRLVQRVGRSGHRIGLVAKGLIIAQDSEDALEALVITRRAYLEELEPVAPLSSPYDVLTHQIAGLLIQKSRWYFDEALALLRKAYPYKSLTEQELLNVLEYMHSRYPRLAWLSYENKTFTRPQNLASLYKYYFENLSMIPDEKQFLVLRDDGYPIGVLDEAFVAEHGDVGTKFIEGGSVWRIQQVYRDRIYVKSEDDPNGSIPTWVGDEIPVPYEVAQEVGQIRSLVSEALSRSVEPKVLSRELAKTYRADPGTIMRAIREVVEQHSLDLPIPTHKTITIESWQDYTIVNCCFGHRVNRTLSRILGYFASNKTGTATGIHQDPYRIVLQNEQIDPRQVMEMILSIDPHEVEHLAIKAITKTGIFKRRLIHVAKKFGVISKDADLATITLSSLVESLRDSAVYQEAVRTTLTFEADVSSTACVIQSIREKAIEISLIEHAEQLTPISKIAIEEITRRSDIVPPERMTKHIMQSVKARLLNEALTILCTACWRYAEIIIVRSLGQLQSCPECGSKNLAPLKEPLESVRDFLRRVRLNPLVAKPFRGLLKRVLKSSELYEKHGLAAAMALAGRGIRLSDIDKILEKHYTFNDDLINAIIETEKAVLKRRYSLDQVRSAHG